MNTRTFADSGATRSIPSGNRTVQPTGTRFTSTRPASPFVFATVFVLAESTGARLLSPTDASTPTTDGGGSIAIVMALTSVLVALAALRRAGQLQATLRAISGDIPMALWFGFAVLGSITTVVTTEIAPASALIGTFRLTSAALIAIGCLVTLGLRDTLVAAWIASIAISAASLGLVVVSSELAHNGPLNDVFAGVLNWNSAIGFSAGLSILLTLTLRDELSDRWNSSVWIFALPLAAVILFLSNSRTAQFATALAIAALIAEKVLPRRSRLGFYALLGAFALAAVPTLAESVLGLAGKDLSFSGRTEVWQEAVRGIASRPLTGWGMGNYWSIAAPIIDGRTTAIDNAHNGYLEVLLGAGVLAILPIAALVGRVIRHTVDTREIGRQFPLGPIAVLILSANVTLSLVGRNGILPMLFIVLAASPSLLNTGTSTETTSDD